MTNSRRWRSTTVLVVAPVLLAAGCVKQYQAPELPRQQLATVSVDSRATLLSVDGLSPPPTELKGKGPRGGSETNLPLRFPVGTGCRVFSAKYKESYFIWGEDKANRKGLGRGVLPALGETEIHNYESSNPITFFVPTRAGYTYWVTATFTGDEFLPRVVEIEPGGESVAHFLPDVPCGGR